MDSICTSKTALTSTFALALNNRPDTTEQKPLVRAKLEPVVGLMWHNPNSSVLVEGPEMAIRPVGIRRRPSGNYEGQQRWR
jgi:hypothetical protein